MKKLFIMMMTLTLSLGYSQQTKNCNDTDCYSRDVLNKPINATNWTVSSGTPTFNSSGDGVWIWSYGNRGESISTTFNFQKGKKYCITLEYRLSAVRANSIDTSATFNVLAVNNLVNANYPTYSTNQPILKELYNNHRPKVNSGSYNNYQTQFIAGSSFTDILIIPMNSDNGINGSNANQVNFEVKNFQIKEVIDCPCKIKVNIKTKYLQDCKQQFYANTIVGLGTSIKGYLWNFGDGTTSTLKNPAHSYTSPGSYTVTLTVYGTDKKGNCCTETFKTKVYIKKECPQECAIKSSFKVYPIGSQFSRRYNIINTSVSNGFTSIVGYEWYLDGRLISTQKDILNMRLRGKKICLRVYGITKNGDCCFDEYCTDLKGRVIYLNKDKVKKNPPIRIN